MKKLSIAIRSTLIAALLSAGNIAFAQTPVQKAEPSFISHVQAVSNMQSLNKALHPQYLQASRKYLKNVPASVVSRNSGATARFTIQLNKGGNEAAPPSQTTTSSATQEGGVSCVVRNVNERVDYFRQPVYGQTEFIYPGALLDAAAIINNQYGYYVPPASYQRQPYRISANLFTMTGKAKDPTETIGDNEDYSLASFRAAKSQIVHRNAAANPPVDVQLEYIEANTQEEVAMKLGFNLTASVPAELVAMFTGIPVGANASRSAELSASQNNIKSRLILKVNFNFYSIDASPSNDNHLNFLTPTAGSDIPNNVAYVSSVLYGTTGYVYFESNKSQAELSAAVSEALGVSGPANQGSASVNISASARAKFAATVSKMIAYGRGLGVPANSSVTLTSLDQLVSLIGTLRNWGPDNQGVPIAYTMNFLKDGIQAVVSYSTQFQNKVCTQPELASLRFDVELELERLDVSNVRDIDGTEDLYGNLAFLGLKTGARTVNNASALFVRAEDAAASQRNGSMLIDKRVPLAANLSFNELQNLELSVGGKLLDDEGAFGSRVFKCDNCVEEAGGNWRRTLKFVEMPTTANSINALRNNGNFQALKFGDDGFFQLNFYESGKAEDGTVKAYWKVWVKPHQ